MSRPRKTVEVAAYAAVLQRAVLMPNVPSEERKALTWALEVLLMQSDNYKGYRYVGGYRPLDDDFDEFLRSYYGVAYDESGTVLDAPQVGV